MHRSTEWVIEDVGNGAKDSDWRALYSACITLTLAVLGSTILPVPYAISQTGIAVGCLTMLLVAFCNVQTCCMLIRAAEHTGLGTYEALAEWAGGPWFKVFTQLSLIVLLYGTMCGGLALLSDISQMMVAKGLGHASLPALLLDRRVMLVVITLAVLLPLCLQRHIRQVETAATLGFLVVIALGIIIVVKAWRQGFPAIRDGELPLFSLKVNDKIFEAFAVIGFAFYIQPMLMPLCQEMPPGHTGIVLMQRATNIVIYGVACLTYGTVGVFGAALYGQETQGNIMVNNLVADGWQSSVLYAALILYLCVGMVTTHFALRSSLDLLIFGAQPFTWARQVLLTCGILGASLVVALLLPTAAEKIFALTGCSAVCVVCYVVPCVIDVKLLHHVDHMKHKGQVLAKGDGSDAPLLAALNPPSSTHADLYEEEVRPVPGFEATADVRLSCGEQAGRGHSAVPPWSALWGRLGALYHKLLLPGLLVCVGVGFSLAGLYVSMKDLMDS